MRVRGFTLIEVMVALVIITLALAGIIASSGRYAANAAYLREKTVAMWVAHNRLTEFGIEEPWPDTDTYEDDVEMGGHEWHYEIDVQSTPDPDLRRIDIRVSRGDDPETVLAVLSSFSARSDERAAP